MATRTEQLQIKLEISGDGSVKASLAGVSEKTRSASEALAELKRELREVKDRADPAGASLRRLADDQEKLAQAQRAGLLTKGEYNLELSRLERNARGASPALRALGGAIAAVGIERMVRGLIEANVEYERSISVLKSLEGTQAAAVARYDSLNEAAAKTPFTTAQLTDAYIKLKGFGLDPMAGSLQAIIDLSSTLGGSYETMSGLVLAFGQANAKGKLQGEEILQLVERGVPVWALLEKQIGKTAAEIGAMATKGELGRDVIAGLIEEVGRLNMGAAASQAGALGGQITQLQGAAKDLSVAIGKGGLNDDLKFLLQGTVGLTRGMADLFSQVEAFEGKNWLQSSGLVPLLAALNEINKYGKLGTGGLNIIQGTASLFADSNAEIEQQISLLGQVEGAYEYAAGIISKVKSQVVKDQQEATTETAKLLEKLREEEATYGLSKVALLDYEKAQALATATTAEQRAEIEKLYTSLRTKVAAEEASGKATKTNAAEVKRFVDQLKEQIAAHGKTEEQLLREEAARMGAAAATDVQRKAIAALTQERIGQLKQDAAVERAMSLYEGVLDDAKESTRDYGMLLRDQASILGGPVLEAQQRYADMLVEIAAKERALALEGKTASEIAAATATARANAAQIFQTELKDAERQVRDAAMAQVEGFGRVWLNGIDDLRPALRDGLMGGDWGDIGKSLAQSIVAGMLDTFLNENLIKPLQNAFMQSMQGDSTSGGGFFGAFQGMGQWGQFGSEANYNAAAANGPPQAMAGSGGPGIAGYANVAAGAYSVYDNYQNGPGGAEGALSGAASGAMTGAAIGSIVPVIGTAIGAVVGAIIGGLAGLLGGAKDPDLRLGAVGQTRKPERGFETVFGSMQVGVRGGVDENDFIGLMQQFDQSIADLVMSVGGGAEEMQAITDRLATWSVDLRGAAVSSEAVLSSRFAAIVEAIEPTWSQFLGQIDKVEERVEAFQALYNLRDQIASFDGVLASLSTDPLARLGLELTRLNDNITTTTEALAAALEAQDAVAIRDASVAAQQAIIERYNTEINLVQTLQSALEQAQAQARSTDLQLAQRIVGTGGPGSLAIDAAAANMVTTRGLVGSTSDPTRALSFLSEFVGSVDAWLQASIADVQRLAQADAQRVQEALAGIATQRDALNASLATLQTERDGIIAGATARAQAEADAAQRQIEAIAQQQEAAKQARIGALQEELSIAGEYQRLLEQARQMMKDLTYSASNPLGGQARLALLSQDIEAKQARVAGSRGAERAGQATELLDLLQQRLSLVQSEGLMQRPGNDYLALYNETLRQIAGVEALASPEADLALRLQEELNRLQEDTARAVREQTDIVVRYNAEEQARLDAIVAEEAAHRAALLGLDEQEAALRLELKAIEERAAAAVEAINAEARTHYEWARGEAARLEKERADAILAQLNLITGGLSVDEFIAQRSAESTALLTDIRDDLRNFLAAISGGAYTPIGGNPPPPGVVEPPGNQIIGRGGGAVRDFGVGFAVTVNVASGDPTQIARAVHEQIDRSIPQLATRIKREMSTA